MTIETDDGQKYKRIKRLGPNAEITKENCTRRKSRH